MQNGNRFLLCARKLVKDVIFAARVCLMVGLVMAECWAVRPYEPVHPDPLLEPWRWRSFPELNGMGLRCMAEDTGGNMWFGVDDGVVRYDGLKWTPYTERDGLLSVPVFALCATRGGRIYAATEMGISRFSGGAWRRVFPPEAGMPWSTYDLVEASDGSLWAGTVWGALHIQEEKTVLYTSEDMGNALREMAPWAHLVIVPEAVVRKFGWVEGIGVRIAAEEWGEQRGRGPWVIWAVAPGSSAEAAELKVGDRILSVDGIQPSIPSAALQGREGTPVTLKVQRKGQIDPFDLTIVRERICGTMWYKSGSHPHHYETGIDTTVSHEGRASGYIRSRTDAEGFGILRHMFGADDFRGKRLRMSGYVKTDEDVGSWAALTAEIYGPDARLRFDESRPEGAGDWERLEIALDVPENSSSIQFGIRLETEGQVWMDDVRFEVVAENDPEAAPLGNTERGSPRTSLHYNFEEDLTKGDYGDFSVSSIYEDRQGSVWFGLDWGGIVCFDPGKHRSGATAWRLYGERDGLTIGATPRVYQTRDTAIWVVYSDASSGVDRFDGEAWTHFNMTDVGGSNTNLCILQTQDRTLWVSGYGTLYAYRNGVWTAYKSSDLPIPAVRIADLLESSDGALWLAGLGQEAVRLDYGTSRWTTCEGLKFQCETPDGAQWFISEDSTAVRYDGNTWMRYDAEDGLMDVPARLIVDRDGVVWAAGSHVTPSKDFFRATGGILPSTAATARFDGPMWSLQAHPRLSADIGERSVYESSDGSLWFGTASGYWTGQSGGVLRFDGETWMHYTSQDGAPLSYIYGIGQTSDGVLWFGGTFGLRCFDRNTWTTVVKPEEFTETPIDAVYATPEGALWIGARAYGAFQYDGKAWTRYDVQAGLPGNHIKDILQTGDGTVWVTTEKGISRFDGRTWTTPAFPSGLTLGHNVVLRQSRHRALWINDVYETPVPDSSAQGEKRYRLRTTRYEMDTSPPETEITVEIDRVSQPGNTVMSWTGIDAWNVTPDEGLQYAHRLDGAAWTPFSPEKSQVFFALASGGHTFEVKTRDRDFNEDPTPAVVHFSVVPPIWRQAWFIGVMVAFVGTTGFLISRIVVRTRDRDRTQRELIRTQARLVAEAEKELQTAHDLQMGLMPKQSPQIEGFDIAGRCISANHVGGDFFQYFDRDGKLAMAVADVTGHAMEAAIPVVMFSGILDSQIEIGGGLEDLFGRLNRSLYRNLDRQTFVCFTMAELDPPTCVFSLCDAGCPYPYHFVAETGEVLELQVDTYPLGVRPQTNYEMLQTQLHPGDRVVFCSDGIIEADNAGGDQFGFERTAEVIRQACEEDLSAEETIERILEAVKIFKGDAPQSDDMTCVVTRVE